MENKVTIDDFLTRDGDRIWFDNEKALSYLLTKDALFINTRPYIENPWESKEKYEIGESTIVVFVECNDVFAWGCADAESITFEENSVLKKKNLEDNELYRLLTYELENERYGTTKFACWKRNQKPQEPIVEKLKSEGVWDEWWEALRSNEFRAELIESGSLFRGKNGIEDAASEISGREWTADKPPWIYILDWDIDPDTGNLVYGVYEDKIDESELSQGLILKKRAIKHGETKKSIIEWLEKETKNIQK